tara:strand:- start:197 stop:409 length:213 start_codon:yes stop_codon:yes gene_type:complete
MDHYDLLFKGYRARLKKKIKMNIVSFIGSIISPKIRKTNNQYIQIGCGSTLPKNFDNLDFFPLRFIECKS